jgi:hypothetical protein
MQSRRNILIIALSVIIGLMFITAGALVYRGRIDFLRVETDLQGKFNDLKALYQRDPFPSGDNVAVERKNLEVLGQELADLLTVMGRGQVESVDQSPPKFMAQFWDVRRELKAGAKEMGVSLAGGDEFDFGFGRHMHGNLPAPQDVPRLTQQLKITQALCGVLYASRVSELRGIGREEFEVDAVIDAGVKPAAPSRRRAEAASASINTVNSDAGKIPPDQLFGNWHFVLQFSAKEAALVGVLNGLARSPVFAVVTRLEIEGEGRLFDRSAEEGRAARKGGIESAAKPTETGAAAVPRDQRVVCGRDVPLRVRMELDVFQFVKMQIAGTDDPAKGAK